MIKNLIALIVVFLLISGCTTFAKREVVEVKVPVIQDFPEPPKIDRPDLEVNYISERDLQAKNYDKIIKSLEITIQQLMDYSTKLEAALNTYRKK